MENQTEKKMRLDKWLKVARIFKTRSQAAEACDLGRVMVNNKEVKAAKLIKVGDVITVKFKWKKRSYDVLDITNKSLPKESAKLLFKEHELSQEDKELEQQRELFYKSSRQLRPKFKGKPTKKDRRQLRKVRGY